MSAIFRSRQPPGITLSGKPRRRGTTTHNDTHTTRTQTIHSSNAMSGKKARARKEKRERRRDANAGEAIPRLLNDIVVTHILRPKHFDDPADLARLPVVSRAMRDAVVATGLRFEDIDADEAVELGRLSVLKRLQRQGRLSCQEYLCAAAARSGQLEELKVLRENDTPWDVVTCVAAAHGGHLEVMQWVARMGARGTSTRVITRRRAVTSRCCSGHAKTAAPGTR